MRQLVQLQENAKQFADLNAELVFVFREEQEGTAGLQKILDRTKTEFTLAVDLDKESSGVYSPKKMTFNNFVIDKEGILRAEIDGTLRVRATAEQLIDTLKEIEADEK